MGFFSWNCAVSGESVANVHSGQPKEQTECVLVTPTETYHEPAYDGYGEFGGHDVFVLLGNGDRNEGIDLYYSNKAPFEIKVVLEKNYTGQSYEELPASEDCEFQGYFY